MDEPESLGAIGLAARENLDNLVFVINCNLQRLDGPVRGNGKIVQELEGEFRGAGWNVIKLLWGWLGRAAAPRQERQAQTADDGTLDGDYRAMKANDGAFVQELLRQCTLKPSSSSSWSTDEDLVETAPRRPRTRQGVRRLPRRQRPQGPAHRAAGQDRQGLWHGAGR